MKRIILSILVIAAFAVSLAAQEPMARERHRLDEILNLTPDQANAWENAERAFHDSARPLFEQREAIHRQLNSLLEQKADACSVGAQAQALYGVDQQVRTLKQGLEQKQESILTPEQRAKFSSMRAFAEMHERREGPPPLKSKQ